MAEAQNSDDEHSYVYIGDINEHLICPICRQPFIDPAQTTCGHTFCLSCITQALQSSSLCPIDRLPISSDDVKPAPKIVASLVNELIVSCPRGCGVDVERGCLKGHLKGTCELEILTCSCGESMTRRDLQHVRETERWEVDDQVSQPNTGCIHEWQQCPHCSGSYQRLHKTDHLQTCPNQQSPCEHCRTLIPNRSLEAHHKTCPSFPLSCPHASLGCSQTSMPRSSLEMHLITCPFVPLSPLLNTVLTRLSRLEMQPPPPPDPEIDRLRTDLNILSQALGDLEIRFSNAVVAERIRMGEEVERLRGQVGALRREVWLSRRGKDGAGATGGGIELGSGHHHHQPTSPNAAAQQSEQQARLNDSTIKQIVKL